MTARRVSVSLPSDVVERLEQEGNASAFVADAVRAHMRREQVTNYLAAAGITITPEGVERMRQRVADLERRRAARLAAS